MSKKHKGAKKPGGAVKPSTRPGGFWDRSEPKPEVLSVRHTSSRIARSLDFLRRIMGLGRKHD
jgi:hypothetical protein